jgi:hypothetical protein
MDRSKWEGCNMLRVLMTCGVKQSHNWWGNSLLVVARSLMKCALKVCMALGCIDTVIIWLNKMFFAFFEVEELLDDATYLIVHNI